MLELTPQRLPSLDRLRYLWLSQVILKNVMKLLELLYGHWHLCWADYRLRREERVLLEDLSHHVSMDLLRLKRHVNDPLRGDLGLLQ